MTSTTARSRARNCGRCCVRGSHGFTLVEVQIAMFIFTIAILSMVGYARVNAGLIASIDDGRAIDGYVDLSEERAIVMMTGERGSSNSPPCEVRLADIDESGPYAVIEVIARQRDE